MKVLLNSLYVTLPDARLSLNSGNVVVTDQDKKVLELPLLNLKDIICFNYKGVSPFLMAACAEKDIGLTFISPSGRFLARIQGRTRGNVLLRKKQYTISEDPSEKYKLARNFIIGKVANARKVINRAIRDHALAVDVNVLQRTSNGLKEILFRLQKSASNVEVFALEGLAAKLYFGSFDHLILRQKETFTFTSRNRRPPLDNINALLSFLYTLLRVETTSALESVGLDPYVGFMHTDRPGRPSLALDLMEELRPIFADRLALTLVNLKQIDGEGFEKKDSGAVLMTEETRKKVISAWQDRKKNNIIHPFLKEKISFGLLPYVQALLLARCLRGDLDEYPPYFWS